jgi:hypothetical protein
MLLKAAAAGGAVAGIAITSRSSAPVAGAQGRGHNHDVVDGPLASATVSFGQWPTEPAFDRFPNVAPTPAQNVHLLTPNMPTIKAGGSVNFLIAGLHNVQIFEPGTKPGDINIGLVTPMTGPPGLPIINDPTGRVYRGLDPSIVALDRVEVVQLTRPGTYLVICGFLFHFLDDMFGYIKVVK